MTEAADVIAELQRDHAEGPLAFADLLKCLAGSDATARSRCEDFAQLLERYAHSQVQHMRCEDEELIPIARRVLRSSDWHEIEIAFAANRDLLFSAIQDVDGGSR